MIYHESPDKKVEELGLEEYNKFFKSSGNYFHWISLTGGEPFVREDIKDIAISALKHCKKLIILSINTNGFLSKKIARDVEEISKYLGSCKLFVNIALDGNSETHNKLRGNNHAFEKAQHTFELLNELDTNNLFVEREITVTRNNSSKIENVIKNMKHKHVVTFEHSSYFYNNEKSRSFIMNKNLLNRLIRNQTKPESFSDLVKQRYLRLSKEYYQGKKQVLPCYSSWSSVFIDPYGNIKPCINFDKVISKLRDTDYSIIKSLNTDKLKDIRDDIVKEQCPGCWTPCEAYQTILQNFPRSFLDLYFLSNK